MKILRTGAKECFEDLPLAINWVLTMQCNYRCSYCFVYSKRTPPIRAFSTLDQLKIAVDNIVSLNRPFYNIGFTGGEPTIHPHISDIISMLHEALGERLNSISITTNGSRNTALYEKLAVMAKFVHFKMDISIHTDHVEMEHILKLIEKLSSNVRMRFMLMFNPEKREMVYEIYETMFEYRKRFPFDMDIILLRDGARVDPRHTKEDFVWQKKASMRFAQLSKNVSSKFPVPKNAAHPIHIFHELEDNGERKVVPLINRTLNLNNGLLNFKGMYCIAYCTRLEIEENGLCRGMVCELDPSLCNIYDKDCFKAVQDNLIHAVKCRVRLCGCIANDRIPKFASEEDAKKFVEWAQKRQAELFAEYDATQAIKTI